MFIIWAFRWGVTFNLLARVKCFLLKALTNDLFKYSLLCGVSWCAGVYRGKVSPAGVYRGTAGAGAVCQLERSRCVRKNAKKLEEIFLKVGIFF